MTASVSQKRMFRDLLHRLPPSMSSGSEPLSLQGRISKRCTVTTRLAMQRLNPVVRSKSDLNRPSWNGRMSLSWRRRILRTLFYILRRWPPLANERTYQYWKFQYSIETRPISERIPSHLLYSPSRMQNVYCPGATNHKYFLFHIW
jgi:hypothetical protein